MLQKIKSSLKIRSKNTFETCHFEIFRKLKNHSSRKIKFRNFGCVGALLEGGALPPWSRAWAGGGGGGVKISEKKYFFDVDLVSPGSEKIAPARDLELQKHPQARRKRRAPPLGEK